MSHFPRLLHLSACACMCMCVRVRFGYIIAVITLCGTSISVSFPTATRHTNKNPLLLQVSFHMTPLPPNTMPQSCTPSLKIVADSPSGYHACSLFSSACGLPSSPWGHPIFST